MTSEKSLAERIRESANTESVDKATLNGWEHEIETDFIERDRIGIGDRVHSAWLGQLGTEADAEAISKWFIPRPSFADGSAVSIGAVADFGNDAGLMAVDSMEFTSKTVTIGATDCEHFIMIKNGDKVPTTSTVVDADGETINVGDTVYAIFTSRDEYKIVVSAIHKEDGSMTHDWVEGEDGDWQYSNRVSHVKPDTQAQLDADAKLTTCDYCEKRFGLWCSGCADRDGRECPIAYRADILRRQREIDERKSKSRFGVRKLNFSQAVDAS